MQLYSQEMEIRCIATLTNPKIPEEIRSTLLGKASKELFHYPPCLAAYTRIDTIARKRFEIIEWSDLMEDPSLQEDFREILKDSDVRPCSNKKSIDKMLEHLDNYRKIRIVYETANAALDKIEGDSLDIDQLLDAVSEKISRARRDINEEDKFVMIGHNNNADDVVHRVLHTVQNPLIPTGFYKYDERNGGLPEEGVMIIAATTSGGKSAVLMNLLVNLYQLSKKRVCRISLEMGDDQEMQRLLSRVSGVPFWKIKQSKLSPKEKKTIKESYDKFKAAGDAHGCTFASVSPTRGMRMDEALRMVKPYAFDVIGVDYVSLLEGVDSENQPRVLSSIVREAKVFSRENKCLVIVLCQLDADTDKIRYSRGMKEHADVVWIWNYAKKEQRETRILPINADKVRDGEPFTFELGERFDIMTVENIGSSGYEEDDEADYETDDDDVALTERELNGKFRKKRRKRKDTDADTDADDLDDYALS